MIKNVISVMDGQAGSCGKAKVVGEIATDPRINLGASITNCMPNAGHTYVDKRGRKTVFRNIPVSIVNPKTELFIGPGSAIDMSIFKEEYKQAKKFLKGRKIYVHEMVPLIMDRHKEFERENIRSGSTFKGCGAVLSEKVLRDRKLEFFKTFKDAVLCSNSEWLERLYRHLDDPFEYVLLEGSQGCDLDLNHSANFPFVTSRNVSTSQLLADSGISPERLLETIMVIRPFPIRISNFTTEGEKIYTGDNGKGDELTWTQINLAAMYEGYPLSQYVMGMPIDQTDFVDYDVIKKIIRHCPEIYLRQVLGENYRSRSPESITLLEALELERLVNKSKGLKVYTTSILKLPPYAPDLPLNTIIDQSEQTTVTKMERRIFDIDFEKLRVNCLINSPSGIYLNFFEHLSLEHKECKGKIDEYYFDHQLRRHLEFVEEMSGAPIIALGTGAKNGERIDKSWNIKPIEFKLDPNISAQDKDKLRKELEERINRLDDNKKYHIDKETLETLLFDTITYRKETGAKLRLPVWSGPFLKKLDLSEISFENVAWSLLGPTDYDAGYGEEFDEDVWYKFNIGRLGGISLPQDKCVCYEDTNAKIDLNESWEAKTQHEVRVAFCSFKGTELASTDLPIELFKANLEDTNFTFTGDIVAMYSQYDEPKFKKTK